jgi:hypothetical protein
MHSCAFQHIHNIGQLSLLSNSRTLLLPETEPQPIQQYSDSQADFSILNISCKWNHMIYGFLQLTTSLGIIHFFFDCIVQVDL